MEDPYRILVIDDDDDIREVAQVTLEVMGGWEVLTARSGQEGLQLARSAKPDGILLDVMMPDMDGPTTLEHLRADPATADIPVIFLTAKVQAMDRKRLQDLPVAGLIAKPFDPLALSDQIASVLLRA